MPPTLPGTCSVPRMLGGVNMPSWRSDAIVDLHAARSASSTPNASSGFELRRNDRRRHRREGLRRPRLFAGDVAGRHGTLFDRKERLAGGAVEEEEMSHLRPDRDRFDAAHFDQHRLRGDVVIPQIVMDDLEVPDHLAGVRADGDDAVGEIVVAEAEAAVVVGAGAAGGDEDHARLRDRRSSAPTRSRRRCAARARSDRTSSAARRCARRRRGRLPRSSSAPPLSPIAEPTMTRSPMTAGGEVTW